MTAMFLLSKDQMRRISPCFPVFPGTPRRDDQPVLKPIVCVIRTGLMWRDAPVRYWPHNTIHNRFIHGSRIGVVGRILMECTKEGGATGRAAVHLSSRLAAKPLRGPSHGLQANRVGQRIVAMTLTGFVTCLEGAGSRAASP